MCYSYNNLFTIFNLWTDIDMKKRKNSFDSSSFPLSPKRINTALSLDLPLHQPWSSSSNFDYMYQSPDPPPNPYHPYPYSNPHLFSNGNNSNSNEKYNNENYNDQPNYFQN